MLKIQDILRASDVKRWSTLNTSRQQSVAEHTFNVVMIARAICKRAGMADDLVTKYALEHDLDEILTGDIITPVKMKMKEAGFDIKQIEDGGLNAWSDDAYLIVKMADMIEGLWFLSDNAIGRYATEELAIYEKRVNDYLEAIRSDGLRVAGFGVLSDIEQGEYKRWLK